MASITTTVNGMAKKDILPDAPVVEEPSPIDIPATEIQAIAKELAQPWKYGKALHRFARLHDVPIQAVREIDAAVKAKAATFAPAEPLDPEGADGK